MAAEVSSAKRRKPRDFMTVLSSAACEWVLIFLLFVDAAFWNILTKFANYCELKKPCLLCSKPGLVICDKKPRCYLSILCGDHIEEISSLVSCSVHNKLADVNGMCEECLLPVAMKNKSGSESYRLLVGKFLVDIERSVLQYLIFNKSIPLVSSGQRTCSCCNKTWKTNTNAERLHQLTSLGSGASKANVKPPLPRVPGRSRFSRRDSFKRLRDKFAGQVKNQPPESKSVNSLSRVGYTKLNITSDSDSEVPLSDDDDDGNSGSHGRNDNTEKYVPKTVTDNVVSQNREHQASELVPSLHNQSILPSSTDNVVSQNRDHQASELVSSLHNQSILPSLTEHMNKKSATPEELNKWEQIHQEHNLCQMPGLITLGDGLQPPAIGGVCFDALTESNKCNVSSSHMPTLSVLSEILSINPSADSGAKQPESSGALGISFEVNASVARHLAAETESCVEDVAVPVSNDMNLTNASSLTNEGTEPVSQYTRIEVMEATDVSDSTKMAENENLLQDTWDMGLMSKTTSPKAHSQLSTKSEYSSPRALPVSASLDRHDWGYESLEGISVNEIEGESIVDHLKRQIEYDQTCVNSLYKELEEERNAAAIAANEAMAMITRLQEEKSALHMEALQYLRMMEEQAEHDMEALEKANELLAEKEKEVQDLEAELDFYISSFPDKPMIEDPLKETCNLEEESSSVENNGESSLVAPSDSRSTETVKDSGKSEPLTPSDSRSMEALKDSGKSEPLNTSILNFEDEKSYISECLKKLEERFHQYDCNDRISNEVSNDVNFEKVTNEDDYLSNLSVERDTLSNEQNENNGLPLQNGVSVLNGTPRQDMPTNFMDNHFVSDQSAILDSDKCKLSSNGGQVNTGAVEKEIAELRDHLEALETDRDFVKHALNVLRNGKDGLQFIQGIANQLQELRKIEFKKRCISIP